MPVNNNNDDDRFKGGRSGGESLENDKLSPQMKQKILKMLQDQNRQLVSLQASIKADSKDVSRIGSWVSTMKQDDASTTSQPQVATTATCPEEELLKSEINQLKSELEQMTIEKEKISADKEKLEDYTKRTLSKFQDKYLVALQECKTRLKKKQDKIDLLEGQQRTGKK